VSPVPLEIRPRNWLILLALLCVLTYLPALTQPFIADDYDNIPQARTYGPVSGWPALAAHPVHSYRPLFLILTYWVDRAFGPHPAAFYAVSIVLHILVTWLVFALGAWNLVGWRVSGPAAAFFAVYEGHQEAVMWYSAAYEPLMLIFGLAAFILWIRWLQSPHPRHSWYVFALFCFVLALFSKESGVAFAALMALPLLDAKVSRRRALVGIVPFAVLAAVFAVSILAGRTHHPRLDDGSFSLNSPFFVTFLSSFVRLFWLWGLLSLAVLAAWRAWSRKRLVLMALAWAAISLMPYSFLTYMTRVPSRQTYLASVGLSLVVGAAWIEVRERFAGRRWVPVLVVAVVLMHNIGYLWTRKRTQYLERAEPTEALIALARRANGPIYVHRFPYPEVVARGAVVLGAEKPAESVIWEPWQDNSRSLTDYVFSLDGTSPVIPERTSADRTRAMR